MLGQPDLDAALAGTTPPVLLLSHNPDLFFDAARRGVALMLAGHTHGGQIRIPGLPVWVRQSRYRLDEGRYRSGATELVVSLRHRVYLGHVSPFLGAFDTVELEHLEQPIHGRQ